MEIVKRISILTLVFFISLTTAFLSYSRIQGSSLVYADSTTDEWMNVTTNDQLAEAFKYYCKSRDLTIDGSVADAVTKFTSKAFEGACNTLGIDITALQAQIKYQTDGNLGTRFLFSATGVNAFNRIFAQFLQDNDLSVGDVVNDEVVDSGYYYIDPDGIGIICGVVTFRNNSTYNAMKGYDITYFEDSSFSYYTGEGLLQEMSNVASGQYISKPIKVRGSSNNVVTTQRYIYKYHDTVIDNIYDFGGNSSSNASWRLYYEQRNSAQYILDKGHYTVLYRTNNNTYYVSIVNQNYVNCFQATSNPTGTPNTYNVYITTNNNTINNNNYEGDTIINNNGDTNNYYPDNPDNPDQPSQPSYPNTPTGNPNDWGVELPNLDIPWFLQGKEDKFPWDIPFNIILTLSLLNAEPQAPHIEGTVDLKVYQWEYDIDLSEFDDVAEIARNMEFVAFLIGLMLLTKKLIWG